MAGEQVDVVVVGAGFAGLSAALSLKARGFSLRVLEARSRVGGRVEPIEGPGGQRWDAGGQFLCTDMPELMARAKCYGLETVETRWQGEPHIVPAPRAEDGCEDLDALFEALDEIDPADPALDGLSAADWLARREESPEAKRRFASMVQGLWCLPPDIIPFWHLAESDQRNTAEDSELQFFLKDGMATLAERMADDLGAALSLDTPVARIETHGSGVTIHSSRGRIEARHVIVAVPPVKARAITYAPPLPSPLATALSAWRSGMVIKILILYRRRFWPESLSSGLMWRDRQGLFLYDGSIDDARAGFIAFIGGSLAADWHQRDEGFMRAEILGRLSAVLGPQGAEPTAFLVRDWIDDRWSGGGYSDVIIDAAARGAEDRLRAGTAEITFASSELSPSFPTYIEGAIIAGEEAAERAASALSGSNERAATAS
ncbi:flavin monoamine oxidase family protein [Rhizobium sp. YIM 134829]|uniref:flavin monoamine oxidase family protein n=1 Tax=Rhizobium sp. YIM 134829 TaxID=3390453 RepID=UPI00397C35B6